MTFKNAIDKANWLDAQASLDSLFPEVIELAHRFARAHRPGDYEGLVRDFQRFVRDSIRYVVDPDNGDDDGEEFDDSRDILARGYDDCDGKGRLFCALCRSVGLPCRIRAFFQGTHFTHVQAEVAYPGVRYNPLVQSNGFLLVELILQGVELGEDPTKTAKRDPATGEYLLS